MLASPAQPTPARVRDEIAPGAVGILGDQVLTDGVLDITIHVLGDGFSRSPKPRSELRFVHGLHGVVFLQEQNDSSDPLLVVGDVQVCQELSDADG